MCMCVHYSEEKIAQAKGRPAREQFGIVRLTQENWGSPVADLHGDGLGWPSSFLSFKMMGQKSVFLYNYFQ